MFSCLYVKTTTREEYNHDLCDSKTFYFLLKKCFVTLLQDSFSFTSNYLATRACSMLMKQKEQTNPFKYLEVPLYLTFWFTYS